jgi:dolichol-phosphate mannosyltransferase
MIEILQSNPNIDLVQGYRLHRVDNKYTRKIPSKIANKLVRLLADQHIKDLGCSLRVFKKHLMSNLILTGEMHRLLTLYLLDNGAKIVQTSVNHRKRFSGRSNYGFSRIFKLIIDVILYKSLKAIFISPIYTFAKFALIGFVFSTFLFILTVLLRVMNFKNYIDGTLISTSIVLFATSTIFIGLGLVAEMVTRVLPQNSKIYPLDASDEHN